MTLTVEAATGVDGASTNTGTSKAEPYVGVAAGRRAYLGAYVRPNTATLDTPAGWAIVVGPVAGGVGAEGAGTGTGNLYVWERTLDGSETGTVTVAGTGVNAVEAAMVTVSKTLTDWSTTAAVSGNDDNHANDRSVTCGSALSLAADDLVLLFFGTDRGITTAVTAYTITETGVTFGAAVEDNRQISNTNNDASLYSAHAAVTVGGNDIPTIGFTQGATNCGPGIAVRVRETSSGTNVTPTTATAAATGHAPQPSIAPQAGVTATAAASDVTVARTITTTVGAPEAKWSTNTPATKWQTGPPDVKWRLGAP